MADTDVFQPLTPDRADLDALRWQARPLLVFAPSADDADYREQMAVLEMDETGLVEREIVVLSDVDPQAGGALRAAMDAEGFVVLLVGKDGGVKIRSSKPLKTDALFAKIDSMPMRQREMSRP